MQVQFHGWGTVRKLTMLYGGYELQKSSRICLRIIVVTKAMILNTFIVPTTRSVKLNEWYVVLYHLFLMTIAYNLSILEATTRVV